MMDQATNEEEVLREEGAPQDAQETTAPQDEGAEGGEGGDAPADNAEEAEEAEGADEWRDKYLRLYAEFDNFRKRTMRERGDLVRSAGRDLMEALLPVLDDFERAMAAAEGQGVEQDMEGTKLIVQKMRGILESKGLKRMEAKGAEFDIDLHEAIAQVPAPDADMKGKVIDVVEPGYKLHDTVLRFAKVVVGN